MSVASQTLRTLRREAPMKLAEKKPRKKRRFIS
jgi:hypothetical protein